MNDEFNKEFMKLNEKDQKSILNLIQLKNMNKQTEYKRRIDKAINYIYKNYGLLDKYQIEILEDILKGSDNNE